MGRGSLVFVRVTICAMSVCAGVHAEAEPSRVTSGLVVAGFSPAEMAADAEDLQLSGNRLNIGSSLEDERAFLQLVSLPTLADGAFVDFSGSLVVEDALAAQVNGAPYRVTAPFTIAFTAAPARLACAPVDSSITCDAIAPFTLAADLTFTPVLGGPPQIQHLFGAGTVHGSFFRSSVGDFAAFEYRLQASPTPEPASLSLIVTGSLMTCANMVRRRHAIRRNRH